MRVVIHALVATAIVTGFQAAACASGTDPARERERFARNGSGELVIGAPWPWSTRTDLLYGQGLQLAMEQTNAEGGINGRDIRLAQVDDGGATDRARLVAQEFTTDPSVIAVIGHHQSHVTAAAAPIYDLAGLVLVSATSTIPALATHGYRYIFQTPFTGMDVGRSMANFALNQGCRRLAVYYSRDDYGRDLANAFEEFAVAKGGQVVARESTDPTAPTTPSTPMRAARVVGNWQGRLIDAIFLATPHKAAVALAVELRKSGFRGPLLGSDALVAPGFIVAGGAAVDGTVFATEFTSDTPSPEAKDFSQSFKQRFGKKPDVPAAVAYDAFRVLVHAMRRSRSAVPSEVAAALRAVRGWAGVTGAFTFSDAGSLTDPTVNIAIIRDGRAQALIDFATAPSCGARTDTGADSW